MEGFYSVTGYLILTHTIVALVRKLHAFYAATVTGPYLPHARNPLAVENGRLGGRIVLDPSGRLLRFGQVCAGSDVETLGR